MQSRFKSIHSQLPPCTPPLWAGTGHLQTLLGHLLPSPRIQEKSIERSITLEKNTERIRSTYLKGESQTVVYLFHGLGGSSEATYMHRTALLARRQGHHVFLNNHRGCGEGVGLASEPYHSGRAEDLSRVIAFGREQFPEHQHIAIGFSLSANALLLLAAGVRADVLPDAAIAVNAPINLERSSVLLTQGLNRIYDKRFVLELRRYVKANMPAEAHRLKSVKLLRDFDEVFTAPMGGFKSRSQYFETCSAKQYLNQIKIPTLILTAEDDPFVDYRDYQQANLAPNVYLHLEKHGGHMGYLSRHGLGYERWLDHALDAYLKGMSR